MTELESLIMPKQQDKRIQIPEHNGTFFRANPKNAALRVVIITANKAKFEELRAQLGDGYGMDVQQWEPDASQNLDDEAVLIATCQQIMKEQTYSPHFILREETTLVSKKNGDDLTALSLEDLAKHSLERVIHTSNLKVIKPQWTNEKPVASDENELSGFTACEYAQRSHGYIKRNSNKPLTSTHGFGWDALFVNDATNLTNDEFYKLYGKKSARQHVVSDFIETYLRYKTMLSLKHHQINIESPIAFGEGYFHLTQFIKSEKHLSNKFIDEWGIERLRNAMLNEGMFVKGALSRPVKNYFSPPFSGLPLTAKKDEAEETTFMTHDMLHHLICDLICDAEPTKENFYVYSAWRMTSEAFTMVLADMLYADGLVKSGVPRSCVDSRIYPLFECIKAAQNIPDPAQMSGEAKMAFIRKLLFANVTYALLGDDSEWRTLLTQADGTIKAEHLKCLEAYTGHFGKFFIGDNAWTRANFDNMQGHREPLKNWIESIGKEQFQKANIPLLSEMSEKVKKQCADTTDYKSVVHSVFDIAFNTKIAPRLASDAIVLEPDETLQSRAFRRFLIGQVSLFSRYPTPLNLDYIKDGILARIKDERPFSNEEQDELRKQLQQYILGIEGLRLMSNDEALNAIDCVTVFPPVYISYARMQEKYSSIANCVTSCVEGFKSAVQTGIKTLLGSVGRSSDSLFAAPVKPSEHALNAGEASARPAQT